MCPEHGYSGPSAPINAAVREKLAPVVSLVRASQARETQLREAANPERIILAWIDSLPVERINLFLTESKYDQEGDADYCERWRRGLRAIAGYRGAALAAGSDI